MIMQHTILGSAGTSPRDMLEEHDTTDHDQTRHTDTDKRADRKTGTAGGGQHGEVCDYTLEKHANTRASPAI